MALTLAETFRLSRMAGESHKPVEDRMIDDSELADLAEEVGLIPDVDGNAPSDTGYVSTYDLYRTASQAWRQKAGMVAEGYNIKVEGAGFNRSEVFDHYTAEATRYAGMSANLSC